MAMTLHVLSRFRIRLCRSILSAVRRIPPEILAHIFLSPSHPSRKPERCRSTHPSSAARGFWGMSLGSGGPSRWRLRRCVPHYHPKYEQRRLRRSAPFQCSRPSSRGRARPRSRLFFDYEKLNDESDSAVPELALQTLARHSARWKALYITGLQCAHLASLSVCGREEEGTEDGNSPPPPINYLTLAPRLRFIEVDDGFPFFEVPWAQLTGYEALGPWAGHITALRLLTNAESCSFMIAHEAHLEDPYNRGTRIIELRKLRQLQLTTERSYHGIEEYWRWPQWVRVPGLRELAIPHGLLQDLPSLQLASRFSLAGLRIIAGCPVAAAPRVLEANPKISERCSVCGMGTRDKKT
ncbi:hypothetical protein B0H14DRAFT_2781520 [Mycena olivaceomarginata]|nr:hypothetical protein B0H14DRAFT_2781520 [Mycena olivaceomarginata]